MAARLNFLVFYKGNIEKGFDYYYFKRNEGHSFFLFEHTNNPKDILDDNFDYYNPHYNDQGKEFIWNYDEAWLDISAEWDEFAKQFFDYLPTWLNYYHAQSFPERKDNVEWGIRYQILNQGIELISGFNAWPVNFDKFQDFVNSYAKQLADK